MKNYLYLPANVIIIASILASIVADGCFCPHDRLILNMGIPIPGKDGLYIETGPMIFHDAR